MAKKVSSPRHPYGAKAKPAVPKAPTAPVAPTVGRMLPLTAKKKPKG